MLIKILMLDWPNYSNKCTLIESNNKGLPLGKFAPQNMGENYTNNKYNQNFASPCLQLF